VQLARARLVAAAMAAAASQRSRAGRCGMREI
jgi:hypothetical protein